MQSGPIWTHVARWPRRGGLPQVEKVREEVKQLIALREQQESKVQLLQKQVSHSRTLASIHPALYVAARQRLRLGS